MKRFLAALVAVAALLTGAIGGIAPASATGEPPEVRGTKFWSTSICVDGSGINGAYYRVAYEAQLWNNATTSIALDYSDDCAADGYPPSRRMVIGGYNNPNDPYCTAYANTESVYYGGMRRWTNGPAIYLNLAQTSCFNSQAKRDHLVGQSIGHILGLTILNSSGYNSRIMNNTAWSMENIVAPDIYSAQLIDNIYYDVYCDAGVDC